MIKADISTRTLRKRIRDLGYNARVAVKKPFVNEIQRKKNN